MESTKLKKLRGGYYTPTPISDFISNWAIRNKNDSVLEPSCGDGVFIDSIVKRYLSLKTPKSNIPDNITAVEINKAEADKAINRLKHYNLSITAENIFVGDFFKYCKNHLADKSLYDCIVGNPPFIRYQDFPEEQRVPAFALMKRADLSPNRLTNAWIPFLIASSLLLKPHGRLGMVIPAELFQVNYAAEIRRYLSEVYYKITIITFRKLVFSGIQQEVVLLLCEKNGVEKHGITVLEINDISDLNTLDLNKTKSALKEINHTTEKWTQYFLDKKEIDLLRGLRANTSLPISGEHIDVDVGIVTGQNKYFLLSEKELKARRITKHITRIIGKAIQLKGIVINEPDWNELVKDNKNVFLFNPPKIEYDELPVNEKNYIDFGDENEYNIGFKCRNRKPWWLIPSAWIPDAFMLRQVNGYPRIIMNKCMATSTDTIHRIKFINGVDGDKLTTAFINSLTFAFSEVTGRSYGGGVLTFEPTEAEKLPLPLINANNLDINKIDKLIRDKSIDKALDINDNILLKKGLDLSNNEIVALKNIWVKMRDRRINRKKQ